MTQFLIHNFQELTVVEGSSELLAKIPDYDNLKKIHGLFEEFEPDHAFDTIIHKHVLEHVENPITLLARVKRWFAEDGKLFVGVPNGNSIHRLAAVKMGLLDNPRQLNPRDNALGHPRVYTPVTFRADIEQS